MLRLGWPAFESRRARQIPKEFAHSPPRESSRRRFIEQSDQSLPETPSARKGTPDRVTRGAVNAAPRASTARCWSRQGRSPSDVDIPRRTTPAGGELSMASRATIRQRDVRSDDADHRDAGLARWCRRSAVAPPAGRAHPCPARGGFATRDSRRGTDGGVGVTPGADYNRIPVFRISREKPEGSELSTTRCGSMRTSTLPLSR